MRLLVQREDDTADIQTLEKVLFDLRVHVPNMHNST